MRPQFRVHSVKRPSLGLILVCSLASLCLRPAMCFGLAGEERHIAQLCREVGKGVVNVSSTSMPADFSLAPLPSRGSGSGFLIDHLGHVLTNLHIMRDTHSIEVTLFDGRNWPARLMGTDPETDLAVLEILAPEGEIAGMSPLALGTTSELMPGQTVLAFGNPFGLGYQVSEGVICSPPRSVSTPDGRIVDSTLQSDIIIHSGNSGGPLVDSSGRVLGINTMIFSPRGESLGVGFAISAEVIQRVAPQLIATGRVARPWLGARLLTVTPTLAGVLDLPVGKGAMVMEVTPKGPAALGGMKGGDIEVRLGNRLYRVGGDIIVGINGDPVDSDITVIRLLQKKKPGDEILVSCYRGERRLRLKVRLEERP
jgi:S1-C subfamily serine protease